MLILVEKSILHFITKMNLFCGGKFLKRSLVTGPLEAYIFIFWSCKAPFCLEAPCGASVPEELRFLDFLDMFIFKKCAFLEIWTFSQKWLPRANHYAHETRSEILCRTPVSILRDLSLQVQNHRKTFKYSFLAWMSTSWVFIHDSRLGESRLTTAVPVFTTHDHDWSGTLNKDPSIP